MSAEFAVVFTIIAVAVVLFQTIFVGSKQTSTGEIKTSRIAASFFNREARQIIIVCFAGLLFGIAGKMITDWIARPAIAQLETRLEFERAIGDLPSMRAEVAEIKTERSELSKFNPADRAILERCAYLRAKQLSLKSDLTEVRAKPEKTDVDVDTLGKELSDLESQFQAAQGVCTRLGRSRFFAPLSNLSK